MKRCYFFMAAFMATAGFAQGPDGYTTYLVPVVQRFLPGANGSLWTTELTFRNRADHRVSVMAPFCGPAGPDPCVLPFFYDAQATSYAGLFTRGDGTDGAFFHVATSVNDPPPAMTLRVRDLSKNATTFGTEIHLPKLDEYQGVIDLIDVPTHARYRATLRAYGRSEAPQFVRVRVYAANGTTPIDDRIIMLNGIVTVAPSAFSSNPSYLQLDPLTPPVRASGDRVRVTVDNLAEVVTPPAPPIWAFITITDNVTQLVSTITPSR
jgi:hypothetical protein